MVRCPNCGSTAQVRENTPFTTPDGEYITAEYVCGCGCYFDVEKVFCPVNGWDCPYWNEDRTCSLDNPEEECDDWF